MAIVNLDELEQKIKGIIGNNGNSIIYINGISNGYEFEPDKLNVSVERAERDSPLDFLESLPGLTVLYTHDKGSRDNGEDGGINYTVFKFENAIGIASSSYPPYCKNESDVDVNLDLFALESGMSADEFARKRIESYVSDQVKAIYGELLAITSTYSSTEFFDSDDARKVMESVIKERLPEDFPGLFGDDRSEAERPAM